MPQKSLTDAAVRGAKPREKAYKMADGERRHVSACGPERRHVSDTHVAVFIWRDGEILTDRAFFGHLLCKLHTGALYPLFEFHWHPSHKGLHAKLPYTGRQLPGAPELALKTDGKLDPRSEGDRFRLIAAFCDACGIVLGDEDLLWNV